MDIIASILAYLTCVAGIVGALMISFLVVFSTPDQTTTPAQTASIASKPSASKPNPVKPSLIKSRLAKQAKPSVTQVKRDDESPTAKSPVKIAQTTNAVEHHYAWRTTRRAASKPAAIAQTAIPYDVRQARQPSSAQLRRLALEHRARYFAYQQNSDFEKRFMNYADQAEVR